MPSSTIETQSPVAEMKTSLPPKTILFATDFSPASESALRFAIAIAGTYQSNLIVAHVLPTPQEAVTDHRISDRDQKIRADAEKQIARFADFEPLQHIRHQEVLLQGQPEHVLAATAEAKGVDLLILGTHGRSGVTDLLLGSVAEAIFRKTACPVITVGPRVRFPHGDPARIGRVLFATDFAGSQHALPYAVLVARENHAKLLMLHVLEGTAVLPYDIPQQWANDARQKMRDLFSLAGGLEDEPEVIVEMGRPAREILATALVQKADLIVIGLHPTKHAGSHAPWAVAHQVVAHAPCPVLTVRS